MANEQDIKIRIQTALEGAEDTTKSLQETKQLLRELQSLALQTAETDRNAFDQIAIAAGRLNDRIGNVRDSVRSVSGDNIQNLSGAFTQVGQSIKNLDFGQVNNVLKLLANNIRNIKPAELTTDFKALGSTLLDLGKALLTNPLFLIGAAIAAIIAGLYKLKDAGGAITSLFVQIGKVVNQVIDAFKALGDAIGLTGFKQQKQFEQNLKNIEAEKKAIEDRYALEISLANAAGKAVAYIEAAKVFDLRKNTQDTIDQLKKIEQQNGKLTDDQKKQLEEAQELYAQQTGVIKTYYNNLVAETNKSQKDFDNNSTQLVIDLIKNPVNKAIQQADLDLKKGLEATEQNFKEQKAKLEAIRDEASDVYGDDYEKVRNEAVANLKQLDKDLSDTKESLQKQRDEKIRQARLSNQLKERQDLLKDLQDKAALEASDQTREFSEKKDFLLKNNDEQVAATKEVYETQIALAQGNSEEVNRLKTEENNTVSKLLQDRNNIFISANNEELQNEVAKQNKKQELEKNQGAASKAIKQKMLDLTVETDELELQALQAKNNRKFGYEKELLAKIAQERKAAVQNDAKDQIGSLQEQLKNKQISEEEYSNAVTNINTDTSNKLKQIDQDTAANKKRINLDAIDKVNSYAQAGMEGLNAIADIADQAENQRLKKGEKASLETQKKQFVRRKILGITGAVMSTAEGIAKAVALSPETGGLPGSAIAAAIGGLQIAKIASQKFQGDDGGGGGDSVSASISAPSFGVAQTLNAAAGTNTRSNFYGIGTVTPSQADKGSAQRVYVLESDITNAQRKVSVIQQRATLSGR